MSHKKNSVIHFSSYKTRGSIRLGILNVITFMIWFHEGELVTKQRKNGYKSNSPNNGISLQNGNTTPFPFRRHKPPLVLFRLNYYLLYFSVYSKTSGYIIKVPYDF